MNNTILHEISKDDLKHILENHSVWINTDEKEGKQANPWTVSPLHFFADHSQDLVSAASFHFVASTRACQDIRTANTP